MSPDAVVFEDDKQFTRPVADSHCETSVMCVQMSLRMFVGSHVNECTQKRGSCMVPQSHLFLVLPLIVEEPHDICNHSDDGDHNINVSGCN